MIGGQALRVAVVRLGLCWLALAVTAPALAAQISPGPLARAHEKLEGSLQCVSCHGPGGKTAMTGQCLACHKAIAWLTARGLGLHAREGRGACASCHPDHAGREFALVAWGEGGARGFDHQRAGWPLQGAHRKARCEACHRAELRVSPAVVEGKAAGGMPAWVGLDRGCVSCHEDIHRGSLERDCVKCHDQKDWSPAPGFEHSRTRYPLTGKHVEVGCEKCHLDPRLPIRTDSGGRRVPVYRPVSFRQCSDCHTDPHRGGLGAACANCHRTSGFGSVDRRGFDHDRTRYPLRGKHRGISCAGCHRDFGSAAGRKPAFVTCASCHADPHAGTATLAKRAADCGSCHGVEGWTPSTLTVTQHRETGYPLEGRHRQVACAACHLKRPPGVPAARLGSAGVLMRPASARCLDCHADPHGNELAGRSDADCVTCHAVDGWKPSTFGPEAHARLRLRLEGRHREIACSACHAASRSGLPPIRAAALGKAAVALRVQEIECAACHTDPHEGRFRAAPPAGGLADCATCHDARRFRPATVSATAHERLGFALEGAHGAVPCVGCHRELERPQPRASSLVLARPRQTAVKLAPLGARCANCHPDPHGGQFTDGTRCDRCHAVDAFKPARRFAHDRDAAFKLEGAHAAVPCTACHEPRPGPDGKSFVRYRPLASACESCHAGMRGRS